MLLRLYLCLVQVWLKEELGESGCGSYLLLWTFLYPVRLSIRYLGRSCRKCVIFLFNVVALFLLLSGTGAAVHDAVSGL